MGSKRDANLAVPAESVPDSTYLPSLFSLSALGLAEITATSETWLCTNIAFQGTGWPSLVPNCPRVGTSML